MCKNTTYGVFHTQTHAGGYIFVLKTDDGTCATVEDKCLSLHLYDTCQNGSAANA